MGDGFGRNGVAGLWGWLGGGVWRHGVSCSVQGRTESRLLFFCGLGA